MIPIRTFSAHAPHRIPAMTRAGSPRDENSDHHLTAPVCAALNDLA